jgi:hypothetical protein
MLRGRREAQSRPCFGFKKPQAKARLGGSRDPLHLEEELRTVADVKGAIVLVGDVCTSGGHLVAARWRANTKRASDAQSGG